MKGESCYIENNALGYFDFKSTFLFPEPPVDFHLTTAGEIQSLRSEVAQTVQKIKILQKQISDNAFVIPFTQKGILAMNQLLNTHKNFSFIGELPEIFK